MKKRKNIKLDVKDVMLAPQYDVETITTQTLENLMKYLDMTPHEKAKTINMKFHS